LMNEKGDEEKNTFMLLRRKEIWRSWIAGAPLPEKEELENLRSLL
jgi:hypothetical protein